MRCGGFVNSSVGLFSSATIFFSIHHFELDKLCCENKTKSGLQCM